jgi:hypothetical protein
MMKIINSLIVAILLGGTAWADGFYLIDLDTPNGITYVQRQGNNYYYSSGSRLRSLCDEAPRRSSRSALWRETFGDLLD